MFSRARVMMFACLVSFATLGSTAHAQANETFPAGSYVIPMDQATQGTNLVKGYGLVYKLTQAGIPVRWIIKQGKANSDVDVTVKTYDNKALPATATSKGYKGGPFIIDQGDVADALPIITAWQTSFTSYKVHITTESVTTFVARTLASAPAISTFGDGNEDIAAAYLNDAGIKMSNGASWPSTCGASASDDVLCPSEVAGTTNSDQDGKLFEDGVPRYCYISAMHAAFGTGSSNVTTAVIREVRKFLSFDYTTFLAECEAVTAFEEGDTTYGRFLTTGGLTAGNTVPSGNPVYTNASDFLTQFEGGWTFRTGSAASWRTSTYRDGVKLLLRDDQQNPRHVLASGYLDGNSANGLVVYLAGHQYPATTTTVLNGARVFLNAIFGSRCTDISVLPVINLAGTTTINAQGQIVVDLNWSNTGNGFGRRGVLVLTMPAG
ncbi:MAG: hypothetical protein JNJ59_14920, partial [Deltaproteobacteria bacterium]|nr:hypothetical protein [Deltaproteobacteria bacterium]